MRDRIYIAIRITVDRIGLDPWDASPEAIRSFTEKHESEPLSRFRFGSPCAFVRDIDMAVHVWLPAMLAEKYPELAAYLRSSSPRWGRSWREW
jgi:hypothetical protein